MKKLGTGKYEATNVEIKDSTREARRIFLEVLPKERGFWLNDLMAPFNIEIIPQEFLKPKKREETYRLFITALTTDSSLRQQMQPELIDTPVNHLFQYLASKNDEINRLIDEMKIESETQQDRFAKEEDYQKRAIKKIIPDWKTLKSDPNAELLCNSLRVWAEKWNLSDDWLMDFAIEILINFKVLFDQQLNYLNDPTSPSNYSITHEAVVKESLKESTITDNQKLRSINFEDYKRFPHFKYKWKNFKLPSTIWCPRDFERSFFVKQVKENLSLQQENIKEQMKYWKYSNQSELKLLIKTLKTKLEEYCDSIEEQVEKGIPDNELSSFTLYKIQNLAWIPSKENRERFIENKIKLAEVKVIRINKASKSLESFTQKQFDKKLRDYCSEIEKSIPKNWQKVPKIYPENQHFKWLIHYQLTLDNTYESIARENEVDSKTVRDGVKNLAKILGLTLRTPKKTGRPKGKKNASKSLRTLGITSK